MKTLRQFVFITAIFLVPLNRCRESKYHSNEELEEYLHDFVKNKTENIKTHIYSIGKSRKGIDLHVVSMTAANEEKIGIPNIKFVGTIHGNEPVGREMILYFMEYLRDNYSNDSAVQWLLQNTKIHFLPNLNPDGFAMANGSYNCDGEYGRNNGWSGSDLNRNFPDYFFQNPAPVESETKAVMQWMSKVPFVLSAGLHGGALVANYPFDSVKEMTSHLRQPPSLTPDDDVFQHLAKVYAQNHLTMHKGKSCDSDRIEFEGGITNGAAWYSFLGGMQDYNYAIQGCMEITLEISCCKYPLAEQLPLFWKQNQKAMFMYSMEAHRGVTGQIVDSVSRSPIVGAALRIFGRNMTFYTKARGEFWRILLPGKYKLEISADGYYDQVVPFEVQNFGREFPELSFLNILLLNSSISTTSTLVTLGVESKQKNLDDASSTNDLYNPTTEILIFDNLYKAKWSGENFGHQRKGSLLIYFTIVFLFYLV